MTDYKATSQHIERFRNFITRLPRDADMEFVLLKGHIMIEGEVGLLVSKRLANPAALKDARLECSQYLKLAKALFPPDFEPALWRSLENLNTMRNRIAHQTLPPGSLAMSITAWLEKYPCSFDDGPLEQRFGMALWSLYSWVAELVEASPTAAGRGQAG